MIAFLRDGVPIRETIDNCSDIRKFITIRQVNGGAIDQHGNYLGKAVRWYYAKGVEDALSGVIFDDDAQITDLVVRKRFGSRPVTRVVVTRGAP